MINPDASESCDLRLDVPDELWRIKIELYADAVFEAPVE
jgi:hypothetical protein